MTTNQRAAHFAIWMIIGPAILLVLAIAITCRKAPPVQDAPTETAQETRR